MILFSTLEIFASCWLRLLPKVYSFVHCISVFETGLQPAAGLGKWDQGQLAVEQRHHGQLEGRLRLLVRGTGHRCTKILELADCCP